MTHPGILSNPKLREGTASFTTDNRRIRLLYPKSRLCTQDRVVAKWDRPIIDFLSGPGNEA